MRKTLIQCGVSLLIAPVLTLMLLGTVALAVGSSDGVSRSGDTGPGDSSALTGITLSFTGSLPNEATVGGTLSGLEVSATPNPADADLTGITYKWSSSSSDVIAVTGDSATPSFQIKKAGTATISVEAVCNGITSNKLEHTITVKDNTPTPPTVTDRKSVV